jgi:hypothetical protein
VIATSLERNAFAILDLLGDRLAESQALPVCQYINTLDQLHQALARPKMVAQTQFCERFPDSRIHQDNIYNFLVTQMPFGGLVSSFQHVEK